MTDVGIKRLNFFEHQFVRARDLRLEQTYGLDLRRRHLVAHHEWGIVQGLELQARNDPAEGRVVVSLGAGMAVDGYGREIFVLEPVRVPESAFRDLEKPAGTHDVWIAYREIQTDPPRGGFRACQEGELWTRIEEEFVLLFQLPAGWSDDQAPALGPLRPPPDRETLRWPIFLGKVTWDPTVAGGSFTTALLPAGRRFIGVRGERLHSPSRTLDVASLIRVPDPADAARTIPLPTADFTVRVAGVLSVADEIRAKRDVRVEGKVRLTGADGNEDAVPLSMTRVLHDPAAVTKTFDLRVRIGDDDKGKNRLAVFSKGAAERFVVRDDGDVVVGGAATVTDRVITPILATPTSPLSLRLQPGDRELVKLHGRNNVSFLEIFPGGGANSGMLIGDWEGDGGAGTEIQARQGRDLFIQTFANRGNLNLGAGGKQVNVRAKLRLQNSDVYFTRTDHQYTAEGNTLGHAAIENAEDHGALLITGRTVDTAPLRRVVKLHDEVTVAGSLTVGGSLLLAGSDLYFTRTNHSHTADGNQLGHAAIENDGGAYDALMILGRTVQTAPLKRVVRIWDEVKVEGTLTVNGTGKNVLYLNTDNANLGDMAIVSNAAMITLWCGRLSRHCDISVRSIFASGGKGGYVVERFVNAVGDTLHVGDVVVLGERRIDRFYGENDSIPIPEADRARRAADRRVCGVVSGRYLPPGEDVGDEGAVPRGAEGWMVTLGNFAHCNVDAGAGAIEIGDLLVTAARPGHAQKAEDGAASRGAVVGKALGSLAKGTGSIPVFVTLQ